MNFNFQNLGIVESANIELNGLTILTGLNDSGKSFISKFIYSLFKTIKDSNIQESNIKNNQLDNLWVGIRVILNQLKRPEINTLFERIIIPLRAEVINDISTNIPHENTINKINAKRHDFLVELGFVSKEVENQFIAIFSNVIEMVKTQKGEEEIRLGYFNRVIVQQLFRSQINSLLKPSKPLTFSWKEGTVDILKVSVENNKAVEFKSSNALSGLSPFNDATIIDTPVIVQLQTLILKNRLELNVTQDVPMPIYYSDLVSKFIPLGNPMNNEIITLIQDIIKGKVIYDVKTNKIVYQKNNGHNIDGMNIANGIKSFGIIQMLLTSGAINKNSILIIDEPEVHLHPSWEIKFGEIIVHLVKIGIPVLISTHSPYLIEAIEKYSELNNVKEKVKFYFGDKNEKGFSTFTEVTQDLNKIYKALAEPMRCLSDL